MAPLRHCTPERIEEAVEAFQANRDRERAFRRLYECFFDRVAGFFARKRHLDSEERLDLTQDTFLRVYRGLKGYRGDSSFATWLFRIAHHTHLNRRRSAARREEDAALSLDDPGETGLSAADSWADPDADDPLDRALRDEERERVRGAIARLPEQRRICMTMRIHHGLPILEIAGVMQLSPETVKAHLFQGRRQLRQFLEEEMATSPPASVPEGGGS